MPLPRTTVLSPLAAPVAELGEERDSTLDRLVSGLSGRWQRAAHALHHDLVITLAQGLEQPCSEQVAGGLAGHQHEVWLSG